jgi:hypothetical protein
LVDRVLVEQRTTVGIDLRELGDRGANPARPLLGREQLEIGEPAEQPWQKMDATRSPVERSEVPMMARETSNPDCAS